jgi:hypothetical protein
MIILTACNLLPSAIPSFVARRYSIHGSVFFGLILFTLLACISGVLGRTAAARSKVFATFSFLVTFERGRFGGKTLVQPCTSRIHVTVELTRQDAVEVGWWDFFCRWTEVLTVPLLLLFLLPFSSCLCGGILDFFSWLFSFEVLGEKQQVD